MTPKIPRRQALTLAAASTLLGARASPVIPGAFHNPNAALGHRLRSDDLPEPTATTQTEIAIVGAGIAGLSAAWRLQKAGHHPLVIELEPDIGGNAASGQNATTAYPWGAHYVPLLTAESTDAAELFRDLGIITGRDARGRPVYDEYALCADPRERLYRDGVWQEDLLPDLGVSPADRAEYRAFTAAIEAFRTARGQDGRKPFAIPVDRSSTDARFRALDRISTTAWMDQQGWRSPLLRWYVEYACRDDYGTNPGETSAWAGIHYFAARDARTGNEDASPAVLTWPGGNGEIVRRLKAFLEPAQCNALAWRARPTPQGATLDVYDPATNQSRRIEARALILATPRFVADRLLGRATDPAITYAPWMVANVTLSRLPRGRGAPLCWDNVIFDSRSLGYVVATHQSLAQAPSRTVVTSYWPLTDGPPAELRRRAMQTPLGAWQKQVVDELLSVHPELEDAIERVDVCVWAHAMARPTPGYLWGETRAANLMQTPPIFHAHSDMTGISIFEEANHHGVTAADAAIKHLA